MFEKIIAFFSKAVSSDNTKIDPLHLAAIFWGSVIMGMWVFKSWPLVGTLADIPQGVCVALGIFCGGSAASAGVNAYQFVKSKMIDSPYCEPTQPSVSVETTVTTNDDDGTTKP